MLEYKSFIFDKINSFYILLFFTVLTIFFTNPLLIYPYDVYTHLEWIDKQDISNGQPLAREVWHYIWENIFYIFHIDKSEIFLRAYIIHFVQTVSIFFLIFFSSKIIIRNIFTNTLSIELNITSYWTTIIWFTIFATQSMFHHQVWIFWYSVNYQITLPFTLMVTALSISLLLEKQNLKLKLFYIVIIIILSFIILKIHAMEYIYYLMYMIVFALIYLDKIIKVWKRNIYYSVSLTLLLFWVLYQFIEYLKTSSYRTSPILNYFSFDKIPELLAEIDSKGNTLIYNYSKYSSNINELMLVALIFISILFMIVFYRYIKKYDNIVNIRMILFLLISSYFIFIPLTTVTGGIASLLTYTTVAHRFYYSALLFFAIPVTVLYVYKIFKIKKVYILHILIFTILAGTFYYSKDIAKRHNYYKNIISIKNSFSKEKMGFNLSQDEIKLIGEKLKYYESKNKSKKIEYYYARDDIAVVLKFVYRKEVLYNRRGNMDYEKSYNNHNKNQYYPVLFEVPVSFPLYLPFRYKTHN